jgi:hypothetical protein
MLFSVKSMPRISVNVAMIEPGMASAEMIDGADVADEEQHDERRQQAAPQQVLLERLDGRVDEPRVVGGEIVSVTPRGSACATRSAWP